MISECIEEFVEQIFGFHFELFYEMSRLFRLRKLHIFVIYNDYSSCDLSGLKHGEITGRDD